MTGQHLTTPHSADQTERSHHTASSEGHQVPGPPHSHEDGHAKANSGPLVAAIVFVLLLAGAALIGFRAPELSGGGARAGGGQAEGRQGILVLDDDGRILVGSISERERVVIVTSSDDGEIVVPRSRVRWMRTDGAALTDEYWRQFGHLPIDVKHQRRGGGIVVLESGEVFVGNVTQDERGVTVSWPYGSQTHTGEVTIPRGRIRHVELGRDTLSDEYWRKHANDPIEDAWRRGDVAAPRQGASRPQAPAAPRDARSTASLAQSSGRWGEATTAWAEVFGETGREVDLRNLLKCAEQWNESGYGLDQAKETTTQVRALLTPFAHLPAVRARLADMIFKTGCHFQVRHDVAEVRRWATALQTLGSEQTARVEALLVGAGEIERGEAEEAHEHGHGDEGDH